MMESCPTARLMNDGVHFCTDPWLWSDFPLATLCSTSVFETANVFETAKLGSLSSAHY